MNISEHFYRGGVETCKYILAAAAMAIFAARNTCCAGDLALSIGADSVDVTAAAGVLDESSELYLVWGDADCGETLDAWPTDTRAQYTGTIDGTARTNTTYTFDVAIPAGKSVRAIATTGVKILSEGEYITLEDGEYLDTGIKATEAYSLAFRLHPTYFSHGYGAIFGSAWEDFGVGNAGNNAAFYRRWRGDYGSLGNYTMLNGDLTIEVRDNQVYFDNNSKDIKRNINTTQSLGTKAVSILLGSTWNANGTEAVYNIVSGQGGYYTNARWYYAILKNSAGTETAHLVPAIYQGKAAFYDTARETVIFPKGSGTASASTGSYSEIIANYAQICSAAYLSGKTATWTGGGDRTDVNDPDNWSCVDGTGATVSGAYPDAITTINISGETDFQVPAGQTLEYGILNIGDCTLTADCDWRGLGSAAIAGTVALGGHTLKLADAKGAGTITGEGKVVIEVAEGATVTNDSLTLTGALQLEKTGDGTFVAAKAGQSYTGGTLVSAGIAKSGAFNGAWGGSKANITIASGAAFDWDGKMNATTTTPYSFNIAGTGPDGSGAMYSSQLANSSGWYQQNAIADMTLDGDALIDMKPRTDNSGAPGFVYSDATQHVLTLNGHTLTIRDGNRFSMRHVRTVGTGKVAIVKYAAANGPFRQLSFYGNAYNGSGAGSDLRSAAIEIGLDCGINAEAAFPVGTLIDRREARAGTGVGNNGADSRITVVERYKPAAAASPLHTLTLGDAEHLSPTLDVSELSETFNLAGTYALTLQSGATITIDIGEREVAAGDKLVAWSADPGNDFTLAYSGEERDITIAKRSDGLYAVRASAPAYATIDLSGETPAWRFFETDGTEATDWDGGVTGEMQVRFSSYGEYEAIKTLGVVPGEFLMSGSFALPAGEGTVDMSGGFDFSAASGATIDVAGRTLVLPATMFSDTAAPAVTSSVEGGALEVNVASGATLENTTVALKGLLKLVKTGAGTFVAAKTGQTYTGGTVVEQGVFRSTAASTGCGPAYSLVTVADTDAAFVWAGAISQTSTAYSFNLKGTGIDNGGALVIAGTTDHWNTYCLKDIELSGDALISDPYNNGGHGAFTMPKGDHVLTLNGYTLTIDACDRFNMCGVNSTGDGAIKFIARETVANAPRMINLWDAGSNLSGVSLEVAQGYDFNRGVPMTVASFTDGRTSLSGTANGTAGLFTVLDTYKPCAAHLQPLTLGDATHTATTLDLGDITGTFDVSGDVALTFASGSTVTVKLDGTRTDLKTIAKTKDAGGEYAGYILLWGAGNAPSGVTFAVESGLSSKYRIEPKDNGLVLRAKSGMVIVIK